MSEEESENEKLAREWKESEEKKQQEQKSKLTVVVRHDDDVVKENEMLKDTLTHISNLEFDKRKKELCDELGLDSSGVTTPEELKGLEMLLEKKNAEKQLKPSGSTVPLTRAQEGNFRYVDKSVDIGNREYSSLEEMFEDVESESKNPESPFQKDAIAYLDALIAKFQRTQPRTLEFQGSLVKAISKQKFLGNSEESRLLEENSEMNRKKERSKWVRK